MFLTPSLSYFVRSHCSFQHMKKQLLVHYLRRPYPFLKEQQLPLPCFWCWKWRVLGISCCADGCLESVCSVASKEFYLKQAELESYWCPAIVPGCHCPALTWTTSSHKSVNLFFPLFGSPWKAPQCLKEKRRCELTLGNMGEKEQLEREGATGKRGR